MKIKIAENIKCLRKKHALTQEQLAEALGVTNGAVYKWEAGLSVPEIKLIMEIADFFEVSIDTLLGYEQQKGNVENIRMRIKQCILEKDFEEAVTEVEKALKKYPNNFDIVYSSAMLYKLKFSEEKDESAMKKSNELFQKAISLLYQNTDKRMNEATILNDIAGNYLKAEQTEQALEILKQNNVCNINNSLIGFTYAMKLKQPAEARSYLLHSFADLFNDVIRTMTGLAFMYMELKDEAGMDAVLWLCDFMDSIKENNDTITFTDKLKAVLMAQYAVWQADAGRWDEAKKYMSEAYVLAERFDAAPIYSMQGIKFLNGEDVAVISYDGIGKTAMEAIENTVLGEAEPSEACQFIKGIWEERKNGKCAQ